ncbi:ladderlectin-like [Nerophis lumbriciformis]|uniref:ladderlectin-like n=1 Tax=Nerophis lumbriciformis TaxID=546530 RepID=UPI003BAB8751
MAFALRVFFLLCGISGLMTGAWATLRHDDKDGCCPEGWTQLNDRCFIYQEEARSFLDAESICKTLGGNLASIHSALEYATVLAVIKETDDPVIDTWIGLHEAIEEGNLIWTDGSDFDFDAFNADNDVGDCIEIENLDELWDNQNCGSNNPYVCARDADCHH